MRIARELVNRCRSLTRTIVELDRELEQRAETVAPALLELPGCGAVTAAKLLAEIGPISRFNSDAQLARHSGVAPLEASSGKSQRHRLDRGGNRQLNAALYRIAITQARYHPPARAYLERKQAEGKSKREALRCLKRQLARTVFNTLKNEPRLDIGATLAQANAVYLRTQSAVGCVRRRRGRNRRPSDAVGKTSGLRRARGPQLSDSRNCGTDTGSCPATRLTSSVTTSHSPAAIAV